MTRPIRTVHHDSPHVVDHLDHLELDTDSAEVLIAALAAFTNPTTSFRLHVVAPTSLLAISSEISAPTGRWPCNPVLDGALDAAGRGSRWRPGGCPPPARRRALPR